MTFVENSVYRIRGIVSLSVSMDTTHVCNSKDYVIFTDVAKYLVWIEEVLHLVQPSTSIIGNIHRTILVVRLIVKQVIQIIEIKLTSDGLFTSIHPPVSRKTFSI